METSRRCQERGLGFTVETQPGRGWQPMDTRWCLNVVNMVIYQVAALSDTAGKSIIKADRVTAS
jgi:hypothetical protein